MLTGKSGDAARRLTPEFLDRFSLSLILTDLGPVAEDTFLSPISTATGPGGRTGVLLCALPTNGDKPERLGYYAPLQDWHEVEQNGQTFWVGVDKEQPIRPVDLVRKTVISGGYVCDLPGGKWSIPVIRDYEGGTGLPKDWRCESNGQVTEIVQAKYRELWDDFAGVVDVQFGEGEESAAIALSNEDKMLRCLQVLGVNYRFGRIEQNLMGVISSTTADVILFCSVDGRTHWDVFEAIQDGRQKKSDGDPDQEPKGESPDTSPGPPGDSPDTGQAEAS
jgi:hypothetical protein